MNFFKCWTIMETVEDIFYTTPIETALAIKIVRYVYKFSFIKLKTRSPYAPWTQTFIYSSKRKPLNTLSFFVWFSTFEDTFNIECNHRRNFRKINTMKEKKTNKKKRNKRNIFKIKKWKYLKQINIDIEKKYYIHDFWFYNFDICEIIWITIQILK